MSGAGERSGWAVRRPGLATLLLVGLLVLGSLGLGRGPSPVEAGDQSAGEARTLVAAAKPDRLPKAAEDHPFPRPKPAVDPMAAFRGLSTWLDTYDTSLTPEEQVGIAAAAGVDAIYVQTQRPSTPGWIHDRDRLSRTIEATHDAGMQVMVWTIPALVDLVADRDRAMAAISFTTPRGDRPDAFGLDIELEDVADVPLRTERLLALSAELRAWAGPGYPMAAVVLPPLQLRLNTRWWPDFPYAGLAEHFDVAMPMSYSSYRGTDPVTTYTWNHDNVVLTRELSGRPDWSVHLAGGIADDLPEVPAFVRAAVDSGAIGAGLYDLHTTSDEAWAALRLLSQRAAGS